MKVGLNATCLNDRPSGAKQRFIGIYGELFRQSPDVHFVIFEPSDCDVAAWFPRAANLSAIKTPIPSEGRIRRLIKGLGYWTGALAREKFDVFEGFHLPFVAAPGALNVLTIHDLRGLNPEAGMAERLLFRTALNRALSAADHVVTVSEAMKRALLDFSPGVTVSVVYNGLGESAMAPVSPEQVRAFLSKFGLAPGYLLAVGHIEPRKNYPRLVEALARLHGSGQTPALVIIGNDSGGRAELDLRIDIAGLSGKVHLLSGLSDLEVRCAYAACALFAFPSSYEGFGIPILEAMAAGRPMVLSDLDVFKEITQRQGVYFSPTDVDGMAACIGTVLASDTEQARIIAYGERRVQDFTYASLARQVSAIHQSLK